MLEFASKRLFEIIIVSQIISRTNLRSVKRSVMVTFGQIFVEKRADISSNLKREYRRDLRIFNRNPPAYFAKFA